MREVNPMNTDRAASWQLYIDSPMPMVTVFKTLELTNLIASKAKGYRLLSWTDYEGHERQGKSNSCK